MIKINKIARNRRKIMPEMQFIESFNINKLIGEDKLHS